MTSMNAYKYEPEYTDEEVAENRRRREEARLKTAHMVGRSGQTHWCKCLHCKAMPTDIESVCCTEDKDIQLKANDCGCIVNHSTFINHIVSQDGLKILRHIILQNSTNNLKRRELKKTLTNKSYRYLAYRQFVYWVNSWKNLGKGVRIVIPSCAVNKIRECYPEDSNIYVGFLPSTQEDVSQNGDLLQFPG
jgi:hypothetical protein